MHMRTLMALIETMSRPAVLLLEVVLITPVETALAPFLAEIDEPAVRTWFATNFRNWLLKQPDNLHKLTYLPPNATDKQQKAFAYQDLWEIRLTTAMQTEIAHLLDFFKANPNLPRLDRMSVENVEQAAANWVKAMNAKAEREPDDPNEINTLMDYPNGYAMVELTGANALSREGVKMGHCVGGYCQEVTSGEKRIFSLRDPQNVQHATIELVTAAHQVKQIKGRQNRAPMPKYWAMIRQFLDSIKAEIIYDYKNVGLLRITDDDTGDAVTMTQDQFRDMVSDPANPQGQKLKYNDRYMDEDTALGLFAAWYGTGQLVDPLLQRVFSSLPDLAVQTVAHRGNQLTPAQVVVAFCAMNHRVTLETLKEFLRLTKPDIATIKLVLADEANEQGTRHRRQEGVMMVAVAQEQPEMYRALLDEDPALLTSELAQHGPRAAGPFFAFVGDPALTPAMIEAAFWRTPAEALKRLLRRKPGPQPDEITAALVGLVYATQYESGDTGPGLIDKLIAASKPDTATLDAVMTDRFHSAYRGLAAILASARKHVPNAVSQEFAEKILLTIDQDDAYRTYLKTEKQPGAILQHTLFSNERKSPLLRHVQVIDPALFPLVVQKLRPKAVAPTKIEYKNKTGKDGKTKNWQQTVRKTPAELATDQTKARRDAIRHFAQALDPLLREPEQDDNDPIDPINPKVVAAKQAFAQMHKPALLDTALTYLNRTANVRAIQGGHGWGQHGTDMARFATAVPTMRMADILKVFDHAYGKNATLFGVMVMQAPTRVAELIRAWYSANATNLRRDPPWGDFKGAMTKDNAFAALEAVWESDLPEGYQDSFASVVLKRFKPSPAKLLSMLEIADSEDVTARIVKKTAKPSVELIDFLTRSFPNTVLLAKSIPEQSLETIFRTHWKLATALMNRDLRGWGNNGHKYGAAQFHNKINRDSPAFTRYETAARAADKAKEFAYYVRQGSLDDTADQTTRADIETHLADYPANALVRMVHKDNSLLPLLLDRFTPAQMAALASAGLFGTIGWHGTTVSLAGIDQAKLLPITRLLAKAENKQPLKLIADGLKGQTLSDSMILTLLPGLGEYGGGRGDLVEQLQSDAAKDWVADHHAYEMDHIRVPTAHMVDVLFGQFGKMDKAERAAKELPYFFASIIDAWFSAPGRPSYDPHYQKNPLAAQLIKQEAIKRGGAAILLGRLAFQHLAVMRRKTKPAAASDPAMADTSAMAD